MDDFNPQTTIGLVCVLIDTDQHVWGQWTNCGDKLSFEIAAQQYTWSQLITKFSYICVWVINCGQFHHNHLSNTQIESYAHSQGKIIFTTDETYKESQRSTTNHIKNITNKYTINLISQLSQTKNARTMVRLWLCLGPKTLTQHFGSGYIEHSWEQFVQRYGLSINGGNSLSSLGSDINNIPSFQPDKILITMTLSWLSRLKNEGLLNPLMNDEYNELLVNNK